MATMNVSLPDDMKRWVEEQADGTDFANVSDYVRDLIRRDRERRMKVADMQALVDEALAGGAGGKTMADVRRKARELASG